ncbi:CDK5 regulatory subunit-associated protein 2, partial [Ophiophagus hannah]
MPPSSGGKGSPSLKQSAFSFNTFDCEAVNDIEDLRQRIRDLKSVVEKYQLLLIQFDLVEPCPPGDARDPVRSDGERTPSPAEFKESEPEFASFSNETEPKEGVEDSSGSGPSNDQTVQKLRELLSENEAELEKEHIANMKLVDEVHRLHDKLKSLTPRDKPDFSICPSLPEESRQRQKIHESHNICATYRQHLSNLIRAFEDLLRDSEVDYFLAESFREQLNQSAQIFERLEHQCLYGESIEDEMARLCNLAQRSDPGWKEKGGEGVQKGGQRDGIHEPISGISSELLMEHLQEIRLLRQRLEDSIKTNNHLRKQLEQQVSVSVPDQDLANAGIRASEQLNTLTSEIHFLRKQNQTLNDMLVKGSREGLEAHLAETQKENKALRESLTQEHLAVEGLQKDHEHLKEENEKLRKQVGKGEVKNEDCLGSPRLQMELANKQHQLSESDKLLCSLRVELKVYEKLDEALRNEKDRRPTGAEECRKDQSQPLDLGELLTEIQFLRKQLEQSITSNQMLHEKVEEQLNLEKGEKKNCLGPALQISYLFELSFSTLDSPSHCNLLTNKEICPIPSHCVWADKNGQHILGLIEDYNCLRKQITEGRKRLGKLELPLKEGESLDSAVMVPLSSLSATFKAVQQNLEEAARLLNLLWRVSLPMKVVHAAAYSLQPSFGKPTPIMRGKANPPLLALQDESLKSEVYKLRRKVAEQEKKLYSMARRLYSTNQLKENMERVIIDQCSAIRQQSQPFQPHQEEGLSEGFRGPTIKTIFLCRAGAFGLLWLGQPRRLALLTLHASGMKTDLLSRRSAKAELI